VATGGKHEKCPVFELRKVERKEQEHIKERDSRPLGVEGEERDQEKYQLVLVGELKRYKVEVGSVTELLTLCCVQGRSVLGGDEDCTIWVWDLQGGKSAEGEEKGEGDGERGRIVWEPLRVIRDHQEPVFSIISFPHLPYFASSITLVKIWNFETFQCVSEIELGSRDSSIMTTCPLQPPLPPSPSSPYVAMAVSLAGNENSIQLLEGNPNEVTLTYEKSVPGVVYAMCELLPGILMIPPEDQEILLWDFRKNSEKYLANNIKVSALDRLSNNNLLIGAFSNFGFLDLYHKIWTVFGRWFSVGQKIQIPSSTDYQLKSISILFCLSRSVQIFLDFNNLLLVICKKWSARAIIYFPYKKTRKQWKITSTGKSEKSEFWSVFPRNKY
jgi:WD40 repeat protein